MTLNIFVCIFFFQYEEEEAETIGDLFASSDGDNSNAGVASAAVSGAAVASVAVRDAARVTSAAFGGAAVASAAVSGVGFPSAAVNSAGVASLAVSGAAGVVAAVSGAEVASGAVSEAFVAAGGSNGAGAEHIANGPGSSGSESTDHTNKEIHSDSDDFFLNTFA